jgi:hypothetical protein
MSTDRFKNYNDGVADPARLAFVIVPSDSAEIDPLPKAIIVGVAGNVVLRAADSTADVTIAALAGQIIPIRTRFVRSTGTTAGQITGLA